METNLTISIKDSMLNSILSGEKNETVLPIKDEKICKVLDKMSNNEQIDCIIDEKFNLTVSPIGKKAPSIALNTKYKINDEVEIKKIRTLENGKSFTNLKSGHRIRITKIEVKKIKNAQLNGFESDFSRYEWFFVYYFSLIN